MDKTKALIAGAGAVLIIAGAAIYNKIDSLYPSDEPTGPGSGEEIPDGPGSPEFYQSQFDDEVKKANEEPTSPNSGDELPDDEPTGPGSGDEITYESYAKGSCIIIDGSSTCVEYQGSYFSTRQNMELHCSGVGVFSTNPCPRPTVGGCRMNAGTVNELITWFYSYGGAPYTPEVLPHASATCNYNPYGEWISG